jgi:transcriptional regulator GlxA family with amidase domain
LYEILISSTKNADPSPFKASAMTYDFVMTLADEMIPSGGRRNWSDPVEDAVAYAQRNYRQQIGVHDLATAAGLSQSYFSRRFTREVGISPYQYLIELRVRELGQRLLQSEETLEKIALDLGFCDANHLCKCFKAATGTTPGEFRRRA